MACLGWSEALPRRVRLGGALLVLSLCWLACATPVEQRPWLVVETPHFDVISGADPARTVEIAERLELLRAVLARVAVGARLESGARIRVTVFGHADAYARFRPRSDLEAFSVARPSGYELVIDASGEGTSGEGNAGPAALHEYVHFALRNGPGVRYPLWYDEGLAEFFSTVAVEGDRVVIARVPKERADWVLFGSPLALGTLLSAEDAYTWSPRAVERFYAQSWAFVHFLLVSDRAGFPSRQAETSRYVTLVNQGYEPEDACREAFGVDLAELEGEFLRYLGAGEVSLLGLPRSDLEVPGGFEARRLDDPEKQLRLGELALALGERWWPEAIGWLRLAATSDPENARAWAALGLALSAEDPVASREAMARALAVAPEDAHIHRLHGESLLARATASPISEPLLIGRARSAFRRSIALDPEQASAHAAFGRSFSGASGLGDAEEGLVALRTAYQRRPRDRSIGVRLAQLEASAGSAAHAERILAKLPAPSHADPATAVQDETIARTRLTLGLPVLAPRAVRQHEARLDLDRPRPLQRVRALSEWIPISGQGGLWESTRHDVVIAIDQSPSTLLPTGRDIDGDGEVGWRRLLRNFGPGVASSDEGDTVLQAEIAAARALASQLDARSTRVGILMFAASAEVRVPLGPPQAAIESLDRFEMSAPPTGTSLENALLSALSVFHLQRDPGVRRQRTILLLSDGQPTLPSGRTGRARALAAADRLGAVGIPVQAFALGESALEDPEFYRQLAERTGGRFIPVADPSDVVSELANVRFTGLQSVRVESLAQGAAKPLAGRAVRVFPNGSFDGYAQLSPGENLVSVTISLDGGQTLTESRKVYFDRPVEPTPEDVARAAELREELANRALELELIGEIRRAAPSQKGAQQRGLKVGVEAPTVSSGPTDAP